jgi:hypothetical protein
VPRAKKSVIFSENLISAVGTAYLIVLFVAGFLTNFVPTGTVNTGTILLYILASILSLAGGLYLFNSLPKYIAMAALTTLGLSSLILLKAALDTNPVGQRAWELTIYFMGVGPFLFFIQIAAAKVRERLLKTLAIGLFSLSAFAIFQSIFASSLPLSLFVLRGDDPFPVGEDQLRPTGLTGNPIIFSSILVLAAAYFAALWLEKRRWRYLFALVCSLVANYLTYTRASIILVVPVLILVWLFHNRFRIKHKLLTLLAVLLAAAGVQFLLINGAEAIIVQRLLNANPESIASTADHLRQIENASQAIASHPYVGTGLGTQGLLITDGAWWTLLLEFGAPLTILILCAITLALIPISKYVLRPDSKNRAIAVATLAFHIYVLPSSFINSAVLGHISFGLYWVALGLSLATASYSSTLSPTSNARLAPARMLVATKSAPAR